MAKYTHIQWTPCAAHSLDLLFEDIAGLTWVTEILTKTKYQQILVFYQFRKNAKTLTLWMLFLGYSFGVHKL